MFYLQRTKIDLSGNRENRRFCLESWKKRLLTCLVGTSYFLLSNAANVDRSLVFAAQQPPDSSERLLQQQQSYQEIVRQKLALRLKEALQDAERLEKISPARAVTRLRQFVNEIDTTPLLADNVRKVFRTTATDRIAGIERKALNKSGNSSSTNTVPSNTSSSSLNPNNTISNISLPTSPSPSTIRQAAARRDELLKMLQKARQEREDIQRTLDTIAALVKSGNNEQAKKEMESLRKKYPENPISVIIPQSASMEQVLKEARILQAQQADGFLIAMRSVDKAAIPIADDIEFDTIKKGYFKEITKRRMTSTLTAREKAILKALNSPIQIEGQTGSFEGILQSISDQIKQPILLQKTSLTEQNIDSQTRITLPPLGRISTRTALRKILQDQGLTYVIKDQAIQVVSIERAREMMVNKAYYIGDLVTGLGAFGDATTWGPGVAMMQMMENAQQIIKMLEGIDPLTWKANGGSGSAVFHFASNSIIVRQSAEVHAMLGDAFSHGK